MSSFRSLRADSDTCKISSHLPTFLVVPEGAGVAALRALIVQRSAVQFTKCSAQAIKLLSPSACCWQRKGQTPVS